MTQTATQWLIEEIHKNMGVWIPPHIQEQAKQMEKKQIIKAVDSNFSYDNNGYSTLGEQYYNETYGNTNSN